jgi:hypothetical protein
MVLKELKKSKNNGYEKFNRRFNGTIHQTHLIRNVQDVIQKDPNKRNDRKEYNGQGRR